jgi:hypothetical protein
MGEIGTDENFGDKTGGDRPREHCIYIFHIQWRNEKKNVKCNANGLSKLKYTLSNTLFHLNETNTPNIQFEFNFLMDLYLKWVLSISLYVYHKKCLGVKADDEYLPGTF